MLIRGEEEGLEESPADEPAVHDEREVVEAPPDHHLGLRGVVEVHEPAVLEAPDEDAAAYDRHDGRQEVLTRRSGRERSAGTPSQGWAGTHLVAM